MTTQHVFVYMLLLAGLVLSAILILHTYGYPRIWMVGPIKSPVKISRRHMHKTSKNRWQEFTNFYFQNNNNPLMLFKKQGYLTIFYSDLKKKPYGETVDKDIVISNVTQNTNAADADVYLTEHENKEIALIKKYVKPFEAPKNEIFKPWGQPHPTIVPNELLKGLPDYEDPYKIAVPALSLTHKVPNREYQTKHGFNLYSWVQISDDIKLNKSQYILLTDAPKKLPDMLKAGYSDLLTQRYITSTNELQNKDNIDKIKYLWAINSIIENIVSVNQNLTFSINQAIASRDSKSGINSIDIEFFILQNKKKVLDNLIIDTKTVLIKSTFTTEGLSSNKKETLQIEGKTEQIIVNQQEFNTATSYVEKIKANKKKLEADKKQNRMEDSNIPKKKRVPVTTHEGRPVKHKNHASTRTRSSIKSTSQTGQSKPKNKITEITDDDDIDI